MENRCADCGARRDGKFCGLLGPFLEKLGDRISSHTYKPGQILFCEGDFPAALYAIRSGFLKLYRGSPSGDETVLRLLGPGDVAGYRALFADEPFAATAEALELSAVCSLSGRDLFDLLERSPKLVIWFLKTLAMDLRTSEDELMCRSQETVARRTARWLIHIAERNDAKRASGPTLISSLQRSEIARIVGTTPETLSRTLHSFARQGILELDRRRIVFRDLSSLRRVVTSPAE
jgi:CRP/FNR family transcriptional regulator